MCTRNLGKRIPLALFYKNRYDFPNDTSVGTMRGLCIVSLIILLTLGCASQNQTAEGIRYYGQAQYDHAITAFQSVLKENPNDPNTLYNIAATYHQSARSSLQTGQAAAAQQQYGQALQYYQLCLAKNANHADAYRGLAALYMDCQNPEAAFKLLIDWYNANPVSVEPKIELARLYQEFTQICMLQGRSEVAQQYRDTPEKLLLQALAIEPENYRALRALGYLKEQNGDISEAVADYKRSLQAHPQQQDVADRITALLQQ